MPTIAAMHTTMIAPEAISILRWWAYCSGVSSLFLRTREEGWCQGVVVMSWVNASCGVR